MGIQQNLIDQVWGKDRPAAPRELVKVHPVKYAGKSFQEKISELRKELESRKKAGFVICTALCYQSLRHTRLTSGSHARRDCLVVQLERKRVSPLTSSRVPLLPLADKV